VDLIGSEAARNSYYYDDNSRTISWDLLHSEPDVKAIGGGQTLYIYKFKYLITVDTDLMETHVIYPTNKRTSLEYSFSDAYGNLSSCGISDFLIPAINIPGPNSNVKGCVLTYNPKIPTIVKLIQNNAEVKIEIAPEEGIGQVKQDFVFDNITPGTYTLVITKALHTMFTVNNLVVGEDGLDLTQDSRDAVKTMTLLCGDVNGDGEINQADLNILWQPLNYNKRVSEGADPRCDLNGDGEVNQIDLNILWQLVNYNKGPVVIDIGSL
jgi:hypothetical protein